MENNTQPFLSAATTGDTTTIEKEYNQNNSILTATTPSGSTALHLATLHNHLQVVQLLLNYGLHPSTTDHQGQSALHVAAQGSSTDIVDILLKQGASCKARDHDRKTPMSYAYVNPDLSILACFLDNAPVCGGCCTLTPEIFHRGNRAVG
ncbi:ankyrin repeat-containing domain protein [Aspergillus cavernicola]|uniref:Ankyrin repeat-containing domain protein n=1 Tax=Aspergillus cavernicola TaxID=176166 RepID=A0ABR4HKV2_9EURO